MIYRRFPLYLAFVFLGVAFSRSAVAQIEFDFPESTVPVLRVDEYYNEANKDRRPMLLVYSDGRVVRAVSGVEADDYEFTLSESCLLYTSPSPRDLSTSRMPSSA